MENELESLNAIKVPKPDITSRESFAPWVERYVNTISTGMRDKSTANKPLTDSQLLDLERTQFYNMLVLKGKIPDQDLIYGLTEAVQNLYDPKQDPLNSKKSRI